MFNFRDQHVVITGAGGGIGRKLVEVFARGGARISACDQDAAMLQPLEVVEKLVFDLRDGPAIRQHLAGLVRRCGAPDILVSNAGFSRAETLAELSDAAFASELDINLTGAFRVIDALLPAMRANGGGAVVAVASVNALSHYGNPAYSAAKAGLLAYIRALAVEAGHAGIRANAVCPGSVMTPAWDHRFAKTPGLREKLVGHYPLGRLVSAGEVAQAVAFLASPLSSGITGIAMPVDAGLGAGNLAFVRDILGGAA